MSALWPCLLRPCLLRPFAPTRLTRAVSTNSAINRGIRRSPAGERRDFDRERPDPEGHRFDVSPSSYGDYNTHNSDRLFDLDTDDTDRPSPRLDSPRLDSPEDSNRSSTRYTPATGSYTSSSSSTTAAAGAGYYNWRPLARPSPRHDWSVSNTEWTAKPRRFIPKLNPDAEWIYGTSVVEAALKAQRRKMYKLHVYSGRNRTPESQVRDRAMHTLAVDAGVEVVYEEDVGMLDSMSNSRPHNGYVLETLPLPKTPILSLGTVSSNKSTFTLNLAQHTPTGASILPDSYPTTIRSRDPTRRYPFVLMLDSILDPGNLGAILRTAYYLGVDAVTLSSRNCAPLSPVCLKASAGAAEFIPILEQSRSDKLISASTEAGWTFYAGVPMGSKNQMKRDRYVTSGEVAGVVEKGPVVLLLGGEGEGLRSVLKRLVGYCVSLERGKGTDSVVDSLNVSVAAALLCSSFLKG